MIIAVTADHHIGNHSAFAGRVQGRSNARCMLQLSLFEASIEAAVLAGAQVYIAAGDIFDNDNPFPDQVAALAEICIRWRHRIRIILMVGNHDQHSTEPNDHALAPLRFIADVDVVETPLVLRRGLPTVLLVPWGYDAMQLEQRADVVIAHHGIADSDTHPAKAAGKTVKHADAIRRWMAETKTSLYLAGDWHEHRTWGPVIQIGALAPVNWTNRAYMPGTEDPYGSLILIGPYPGGWKRQVLRGPRFLRAASLEEARVLKVRSEAEGMTPYIDVDAVLEEGLPPDLEGSVRPPSIVKAKEAAVAASAMQILQETTQEEALEAWVTAAPSIPEDLKREVAEKAKEFLRRAV